MFSVIDGPATKHTILLLRGANPARAPFPLLEQHGDRDAAFEKDHPP
jgi:hypothetical protein